MVFAAMAKGQRRKAKGGKVHRLLLYTFHSIRLNVPFKTGPFPLADGEPSNAVSPCIPASYQDPPVLARAFQYQKTGEGHTAKGKEEIKEALSQDRRTEP